MISLQMLGSVLAFISALVYGSADFFGGLATRRAKPYAVLPLASFISILPMGLLAVLNTESLPSLHDAIYGGIAGLMGFFGLALLYYGLSRGRAAIVSSTSGIVSACLPVIAAAITLGFPTMVQLIGLGVAILSIGLVSYHSPTPTPVVSGLEATFTPIKDTPFPRLIASQTTQDLILGGVSGIFFGLFFISLASISHAGLFGPLVISKAVAGVAGLVILVFSRLQLPSLRSNPSILWAGILDPTANALYLLATRFIRLDIAAVLSSLYPAGTVILSVVFLKERMQASQWVGFTLCLVSIVLITS